MRSVLCALLAAAGIAGAAGLDGVSNRDAAAGVKQALSQASDAAVAKLGVENGFFGNEKLRIRAPESLHRVEAVIRATGLDRQADELVLAMNRTAEAAVPEAKAFVMGAIRNMKVQEPKKILEAGGSAATDDFRATSYEPLATRLLPVVRKAGASVRLVEKHNAIARHGKKIGLVKPDELTIEQHVTRKMLDGLFATIGEEEKALRKDPPSARSKAVQKLFEAVR